MGRHKEFDEAIVLDAAIQCFWAHGYEATSIRDLIARTGITGASLYNAFGDKRALYKRALDQYVEVSIADRIRRCAELPPLEAISAFFGEILKRSLKDPDHKGCMLVNAALDAGPDDPEFRKSVAAALTLIETFFLEHVRAGQADQSVTATWPAETLAHHLLGALMGVRVLARVRPEKHLLEGVIVPALAVLEEARVSP
jgi:TetR/AcrR family transcriptional regulator, transcriptional repressor for nem operon